MNTYLIHIPRAEEDNMQIVRAESAAAAAQIYAEAVIAEDIPVFTDVGPRTPLVVHEVPETGTGIQNWDRLVRSEMLMRDTPAGRMHFDREDEPGF